MGLENKNQFADEKKLREEITDVYASVASQEAPPSHLQLQRVTQLQEKLLKAEETRTSLVKQFDAKVNVALAKEGLPSKDEGKPTKAFFCCALSRAIAITAIN